MTRVRTFSLIAAIAAVSVLMLGLGRGKPTPVSSAGVAAEEAVYQIDPAHSSIIFTIRHFGIANFYGTVTAPTGTVLLDTDLPAIDVTIHTKYVNGGNDSRNKFLASPDFFNVREYPEASFKSNSIRKVDDTTYEADGTFTMRGVSKPITVTLTGYGERTVEKFGHRCAFETTFTIKRSEFGMTSHFEDEVLGDEVTITVSIEAGRPA